MTNTNPSNGTILYSADMGVVVFNNDYLAWSTSPEVEKDAPAYLFTDKYKLMNQLDVINSFGVELSDILFIPAPYIETHTIAKQHAIDLGVPSSAWDNIRVPITITGKHKGSGKAKAYSFMWSGCRADYFAKQYIHKAVEITRERELSNTVLFCGNETNTLAQATFNLPALNTNNITVIAASAEIEKELISLAEMNLDLLEPAKARQILSNLKNSVLAKLAHAPPTTHSISKELQNKLQYMKATERPENLLYKRKLQEVGVQVSVRNAPFFPYYGQLPEET